MKIRIIQSIFLVILTLTFFSFWACFALLVVNKLFYQDLPGYRIGRLCIWEGIALIISFMIAKWVIKKWGNISLLQVDEVEKITLNSKYGIYFSLYFLIAVMVVIWQFWLFSLNF